ncbi:MAG: ABC transporter permease [Candidatus Acidiferrales bacterium]
MEKLWQDIRYGFRMMVKSPSFSAVAVLSLALGIGANAAIFALVDSFLWRPFPVEDPGRLYGVFTTDPKNPGFLSMSTLNYEDYRDHNQVLSGLAASGFLTADLTTGSETERVVGFMVSGNYFDVHGVHFQHGRGFRPDEAASLGGQPVVVISHGFWQNRFGGNPSLLGQTITLNRRPYTVVGIAPEEFTGTFPGFQPALWAPLTMRDHLNPAFLWFTESRRGLWLNVIGRLKPGLSREQALAGMQTLARQLEQQYPEANEGRGVTFTTLAEARANPFGSAQNPVPLIAGLLLAVVGLVLLIACANVANLLLARAATRQKEISVRLAMGAGRLRLVRQLLTESVVLALVGGAIGLLVAYWATDLLAAFQPPGAVGFALEAEVNPRVLAFTLLVSLLTGVIFGLAPAMHSSRPDIHENLKEGGRGTTETTSGRLRSLLVISEVALAVVALIGAGLFVRSLRSAMSIDPGFQTGNMTTLNLDVSLQGYEAAAGQEFYRQLVERVQGIAGVESATLTSRLPLTFGLSRTLWLEDQVPSEKERGVLVNVATVDVGYFETLGIPIIKGRTFETRDDANAPPVAIVNQALAARFWPGQEPLGKRIRFPAGRDGEYTPLMEVVGVARYSKVATLGEEPTPLAYFPFRQDYNAGMTLVIQSAADPAAILPSVRREIRAMDPGLPIFNVQPLTQVIAASLFLPRMGAYLLAAFGLLALVLAAGGIYGVISYAVTQRTHEIGIRMALGAERRHVLRLVLVHGMTLVGIGLGIGLAGAFAASRVVSSLLYGVSAADPLTFSGITLILTAVALLACWIPARRAARVDPMVALRYE